MVNPNTPTWNSGTYKPNDVVYVRTAFGLERGVVIMVVDRFHVRNEDGFVKYVVRLDTSETTVEVSHDQIAGG